MIIALLLSLALNVLLVRYSRKIVSDLSSQGQQIEELLTDLKMYHQHVETVYNLQTFYGDETLKALLMHSREVSDRVSNFTTLFSVLEEMEEQEEEGEDDFDDDDTEEAEETAQQIPEEKKHLLFAGTRRRNP